MSAILVLQFYWVAVYGSFRTNWKSHVHLIITVIVIFIFAGSYQNRLRMHPRVDDRLDATNGAPCDVSVYIDA